jgi:(p)ppGpp synthase/HD superfamily hydrolase
MNVVEFAKLKHGDQKRKYTNEPYWYHLEEVAYLVRPLSELCVWAAWLHDVLEDTNCTFDEIEEKFGSLTAENVLELSDLTELSAGNRRYRKTKYKDSLKDSSSNVQSVKVADLISNSISIKKYDPNFAKVYLSEKKELLEILTRADPVLLRMAWGLLDEEVKGDE